MSRSDLVMPVPAGGRFPPELVRRVVGLLGANSLDSVPSSASIPASIFTDPDLFAREREVLFRRTPQVVGWASEVAEPGSYTVKDVAGVSVLITRADDGVLRAFANACSHRGAQVAHGCGTARRLTCPYHAWTFHLDGRLAGQTEAWAFDDLDPADLGLTPLPIAEQCELMVVGLRPDVVVDGALDEVAPHLQWTTGYQHQIIYERRFHLRSNWKLAVDVNLEAYHVAYLHRETLHPMLVNATIHDTFGRFGRHAFPMRAMASLVDKPEAKWPALPMISVVHTFFPSCVILESPVSSQMLKIYPGLHPGECTVDVIEASLNPVRSEEERAARLHGFEIIAKILEDEDFPAAEGCQRGVESGLTTLRFGKLEPMLQHWHRVWADAVRP